MRRSEAIEVRANLRVVARCARTGRVKAEDRVHNLTLNGGLELMLDCIEHGEADAITEIAFGTDGTLETSEDVGLGAEVDSRPLTGKSREAMAVTFELYLSTATANGNTLREAALRSQSGTYFARGTHAAMEKDDETTIQYTWEVGLTALAT